MFFCWLLLFLIHRIALTAAVHSGFNYGSMNADNTVRTKEQFIAMFKRAKSISTDPDAFNSARLFMTRHQDKGNFPGKIHPAIEAAVETGTTLLLGLWCGNAEQPPKFDKSLFLEELDILDSTLRTHPKKDRILELTVGISVCSEDIYRHPEQRNNVIDSIKETRSRIRKYSSKIKIGHADIYRDDITVYKDVDFVSINIYPFWEGRDISNKAMDTLFGARNETVIAAAEKADNKNIEVWVTETGWPFAGAPVTNKGNGMTAQVGINNMQTYWKEGACKMLGNVNFWWFEIENSKPPNSGEAYDWGVFDHKTKQPRFDLSCNNAAAPKPATPSKTSVVTRVHTVMA